jgi:hypothetical protein
MEFGGTKEAKECMTSLEVKLIVLCKHSLSLF